MIRLGVFDSGLGGLVMARYLKALRPDVSLLYFGDTVHLPYGDKSPIQIRTYVRQIIAFLKAEGAEGIVMACNTASSLAREEARVWASPLPVWDTVSATLSAFRREGPLWPLGILGTYATIRSGAYSRAIRTLWPQLPIIEHPTPLLVPLVEEGWVDHPATELILQSYLQEGRLTEARGLLLACTHYSLLEPVLKRVLTRLDHTLAVYDTAALLADFVVETLPTPSEGEGEDIFLVSDYSERFAQLAQRFWGSAIQIEQAPRTVFSLLS